MLGDILAKLANGEKLDSYELEALQRIGNGVESNNSVLDKYIKKGSPFLDFKLPLELLPGSGVPLDVDSASLSIDVPATYKHLLVFASGRITGIASYVETVFCQFNGDTGSNYQYEKMIATASSVTAAKTTGTTKVEAGAFQGPPSDNNSAAGFFLFIPDYASKRWKNTYSYRGSQSNNASGDPSAVLVSGAWLSVDPIINILFTPGSNNLAADSIFSVYGIR